MEVMRCNGGDVAVRLSTAVTPPVLCVGVLLSPSLQPSLLDSAGCF